MQFRSLLASTALAALASAQSSSSSAATATATPGTPLKIEVGNGGLNFNPNTVTAPQGSTLQFVFYPNNHSVAQGDFDSPCQPSDNAVYSGFLPSTSGTNPTTFTLTVNDTNPIWLYCSQVSHCQSGMAMVINPPSSGNTLDAYISAAQGTSSSDSPPQVQGGVLGPANSPGGPNTPASSSAGGSSTPAPASSTAASSGGSGGGSSTSPTQAPSSAGAASSPTSTPNEAAIFSPAAYSFVAAVFGLAGFLL